MVDDNDVITQSCHPSPSIMGKPTMEGLKQLIEALKKELTDELTSIKDKISNNNVKLDSIDSKFTTVFSRIEEISKAVDNASKTANDALTTANQNQTDITTIKDTLSKIDKRCTELENDKKADVERIHSLENKLEDQVNRSSRKTIVVRGIKENNKETWEDTRVVLAKQIAKVANIEEKNASSMIERVHRSRPNPHREGKRDIIAAFYDWNDSEYVMRMFRDAAKKGQTKGIFVDQKYGPLTTARRNHALLQRKSLIADKTITNGYVAYPAKLMIKKNKSDTKYVLHEDYSDMTIDM